MIFCNADVLSLHAGSAAHGRRADVPSLAELQVTSWRRGFLKAWGIPHTVFWGWRQLMLRDGSAVVTGRAGVLVLVGHAAPWY